MNITRWILACLPLMVFSTDVCERAPLIRSIALVSDSSVIPIRSGKDDGKVFLSGVALPGSKAKLDETLEPYFHRPITDDNLESIKDALLDYYQSCRQSMVTFELFDQDVTEGAIAFSVISAKVDHVEYTGNRWFRTESIKKTVPICPHRKLDEQGILEDLSWMNRNPFLHGDLIFSPGSSIGETDATVQINDRLPLRVYSGIDNTGVEVTGTQRLFAGFNASPWINTLISYQFTSAWDFPELLAHYGNITLYLPWKQELAIYGGFATIHPKIEDFPSKGFDVQASLRYGGPLGSLYTDFRQELTGGADYKLTNSDLFFLGGTPDGRIVSLLINRKIATIFQFYAGYRIEKFFSRHHIIASAEAFGSPFYNSFPHQTNSDYNGLRAHATPQYFYARLSVGNTYEFSNRWSLSGLLRTHLTPNVLLPSEMFGLGGYDTVRGYDERVYNADNALCANFEVRTPPASFFRAPKNELIFLAFMDLGLGQNNRPSDGFSPHGALWSVGPGFRYTIFPYVTARGDYGFKLTNLQFEGHNVGKFHFSVIAGY